MNDIIRRHELVQQLLDNGWLHLFQMDAEGQLAHRYAGDMKWEPVRGEDHDEASSLEDVEAVA